MSGAAKVRKSGILVPLGALRSADSRGVGEYPDLLKLGEVCAAAGLSFVQILPVNDTGFQSSPYSALSAFALHPLYLRIGDIPEAAPFREEARSLAGRFEKERRFPYPDVLSAKLDLLREIFRASLPALRGNKALEDWIAANPWVREYAVFLGLKERNGGKSWKDWPEHRDPAAGDIDRLWADESLRDGHLFHAWVQMRCEEQFRAASKALASRGIFLKGDLPILMNDDSADVWAHRSWFRMDRIAGAPPDMFSRLGQNWGFPVYNWEALARDGYSFWVDRLKQAAKFYGAYRIDHVLGFFRIWALPEREESGYLGSFEPGSRISREELAASGFSPDRVRWLSLPHIREDALQSAASPEADPAAAAARAAEIALDRIGGEPLFLFRDSVRGEKDIRALDIPDSLREFLMEAWRDRALLESEPDRFSPAWRHSSASAWGSLSDSERNALEGLIRSGADSSEALWEERGRVLLKVLKGATEMLPCAEDLGAVPPCVPKVLAELDILGLRIPRWSRRWDEPGEPWIDPGDYPEGTVCSPSVHDTSTVRDWWEHEAGPEDRKGAYGADPGAEAWSPRIAERLLGRWAAGASVLLSVAVQDILDLSETYASEDSRTDRVNVPGTISDTNWTWRMPMTLETLAADKAWTVLVRKTLTR